MQTTINHRYIVDPLPPNKKTTKQMLILALSAHNAPPLK